jgi:hypothetical protein
MLIFYFLKYYPILFDVFQVRELRNILHVVSDKRKLTGGEKKVQLIKGVINLITARDIPFRYTIPELLFVHKFHTSGFQPFFFKYPLTERYFLRYQKYISIYNNVLIT